MSPPFDTIDEAIADIREGRTVIVCDGEDRENEGDLVMAAQFATPESVNFMAKEARGLICLALSAERCDELGLSPMTRRNQSLHDTAFTVSIEARHGVTTGISAHDRARTIQTAIDPASGAEDLVQPGHIFPLRARRGGVLERSGHTEAAVDLARLAGVLPAGVICEILNDDGTMARVGDLIPYAARHGLRMITVAELIAHRRQSESLVERVASARLPTPFGVFQLHGYRSLRRRRSAPRARLRRGRGRARRARARALRVRHRRGVRLAALRLRRAAAAGHAPDLRGGRRSDRVPRPGGARDRAAQQGARVRTAGHRRVSTPSMPTSRWDLPPTCATSASAPRSWPTSGCRAIRLLTNNPRKIIGLEGYGLEVVDQVPIEVAPHPESERYMLSKALRLGHTLERVA